MSLLLANSMTESRAPRAAARKVQSGLHRFARIDLQHAIEGAILDELDNVLVAARSSGWEFK